MRILITGATGYIGGRLVPRLLEAGHEVRCLARRPDKLDDLPWRDRVEVVPGDALDAPTLEDAAADCHAGIYLIHSLASGKGFEERDREAASNFRDAADAAGMLRTVYLGVLGPTAGRLAPYVESRREVGSILASGSTPATELRSGAIIGSGSLSFEMVRSLSETLPVMAAPRWMRVRCRPVAVNDVLDLLVRAIDDPSHEDRILGVGGPDALTHQEMMKIYAGEAGLRRRILIPIPLRWTRLSSIWVGLVTPLPSSLARPVIDALRTDAMLGDGVQEVFPFEPASYVEAIRDAVDTLAAGAETRWSDAESNPAQDAVADREWAAGTVYEDQRIVPTDALPHHMFWACTRIGGNVGYYGMNWAWRLRGLMDQMVGGVGLRRGRRHPENLRAGEAVDFWRVDRVIPNQVLRLHAEMRIPGEAWLEWRIVPNGDGADLVQTARFHPRGLLGRAYWFVMTPFHSMIFPRMACRMAAAAEERGYSCGE